MGLDGGSSRDGGTAGDGGFDYLDGVVASTMETALVPGIAVALVKNGQRVWSKAYGLADIEMNRAMSTDSLVILASISKAVMAIALLQLYEQGQFGLDDDINNKLPFPVRNPRFPTVPITYRMLMAHVSSVDDGASLDNIGETYNADSPISLDAFVRGYFIQGGTYYGTDNFNRHSPGTFASYSNAGATLLGYLVETISGMSLQQYCQQHIFLPLGMHESSWFLAGLDVTHIAKPYSNTGSGFSTGGNYTFPDYPDGQLRSSVDQLARILGMYQNGGQLDGTRILQQATIDEMRRIQYPSIDPNQGLIWYYETDAAGRNLFGHSGAYIGTSTDMWYMPSANAGYVMLSNGGVYYDFDTGPQIDAMEALDKQLQDAVMSIP